MRIDWMAYESIVAMLALIVIALFFLAALSDRHWRNATCPRGFRIAQTRSVVPERADSDDKDKASNLYLRYADLSGSGFGTAEEEIRLREQVHHNLEDD